MEVLTHRAELVPGTSVPLFELRPPVFDGFDYVLKRSFDFVGALLLILLLSPLLLTLAIAVFVSSRGPVLYRSTRPGIGGAPFSCFKFRTMRSDADQMQADLESLNEADGPLFKIRDDPRQTRVGGFLRRYSLDELPQLFNVLAGSMSLVGPRPPLPEEVSKYGRDAERKFLVKPGLTGLWQVNGRSNLSWEQSVRLDLRYVENWTLAMDALILWKTFGAMLRGGGAY
jgi:exopolysaccharide biosynthesis polyprenyl glycosylphosphotransferase